VNLEDAVVALCAVAHTGDTLVIGFNVRLTVQEGDRVRDRLAQVVPQVNLAIVDQVSSMVVQRA
jgi:predicted RNA-binding protein with TRAM domain